MGNRFCRGKVAVKMLVTGGAGFIGSHLAEELLRRGEEVYIIDNLSTGSLENIKHLKDNDRFHYVIDTIMHEKIMDELINECDLVYHLASTVGVKFVMDNPVESIKVNILGTEIVLRIASRRKKKVIISSSSEVYGKNEKVPLKEEDARILPPTTIRRWSYSCSKAIGEFLALAYWDEKKLPIVIARLFNIVGPRQTGRYGMVIPRFLEQAFSGSPITIYGDGKQTRTFTYVTDVVDGVIELSKNQAAAGEIFNIGTENEISIEELAKRIKEMTNSKSEIKYISYKEAYGNGFEDVKRRVPDISKINRLTGYCPKVDLDGVLRRTIEYFKENGI